MEIGPPPARPEKLRTPVFNVMDLFHWPSGWLTARLYSTRISPHAVIAAGLFFGLAGAACLALGNQHRLWLAAGGILLLAKNVLDKVDGSLARMRGQASRLGRFYDSLSDFAVSAATFAGIGAYLVQKAANPWWAAAAAWGCLGSLLQCSYFVHYQVAYILHAEGRRTINRLDESETEEDRRTGGRALAAQRLYNLLYGWQDRLIGWMDALARRLAGAQNLPDAEWFGQRWHLAAASFLGLGTHIALTLLAALLDALEAYLCWAGAGGYLLAAALYLARLRAIKRNVLRSAAPAIS